MSLRSSIVLFALVAAAPFAATAQVHGGNSPADYENGTPTPGGRCGVQDMDAFDQFIAGKPTVSEFRNMYSCVTLVLPGEVATREMRLNNSRYFAEMGEFGRITGGYFQ